MSIGSTFRRQIFFARDFIQGSPLRKHIDDIHLIQSGSREGMIRREEHLMKLLEYATQNCRFYQKFNPHDLKSFPANSKSELIAKYEQILVDRKQIPNQVGDLKIQRTSGSTGEPFAIPHDTGKRIRKIAELKYFGEQANYQSHEKLAQLRVWTKWQGKSRWQEFCENIYAINCSQMDDCTLGNIVKTIKQKKITSILGYASWLGKLLEYLRDSKHSIEGIRSIIAVSEMLPESTRAGLKELLGCPVYSRYSNEEQGIIAQDTGSSPGFILNHSSYWIEVLKLDSDESASEGELGRIVVTDLFNLAFPLIRYDTGDVGIMSKGHPESRGMNYLKELFGRQIDIVYSTKGTPTHPMSFARILKNYDAIKEWQFIQKTRNEYILKVSTRGNFDNKDCTSMIRSIVGNDATIYLEQVDSIPTLKSGKRKSVICEMSP